MLTVGDKFPAFQLKAVVSTDPRDAFVEISDQTDQGKWKIVFFWPKDFTFVCPTEIASFGKLNGEFTDRDAVVMACRRIASSYISHGGRTSATFRFQCSRTSSASSAPRSESSIRAKAFACARQSSSILTASFVSLPTISTCRNTQEVLRVLDALQTNELCPCNWQKGEEVLKAA